MPQEVVKIIQAQVGSHNYQFLTEDRSAAVTLAPDSLSLTTSKYSRWEHFREILRIPLAALMDIYRPNFFSRIGLRYQDAIDRSKLGLEDRPWSHLIRREVLGELSLSYFEDNLEGVLNRTIRLKIPDGSGSILMRHGLGAVAERGELCYMVDIDLFDERRTEAANAEEILNHFNEIAGRAFRWCISDTLRDALEPRDLADSAG